MRIVTVRNRNHLSVVHSAGMNAESNSSRERTQLYYRYKNSTKSSHGNNPVLKSLESPGYCQACRINRRNQQFSVRTVEMDSDPRMDPFIRKKCRIRTQRIKVHKNADPIESDPLGLQSSRTGPNRSRTGPHFFFFLLYDT